LLLLSRENACYNLDNAVQWTKANGNAISSEYYI